MFQRELLEELGLSISQYKNGEFHVQRINGSTSAPKDPWAFYRKATHDLHEVVESVKIFTTDPNHPSLKFSIGDKNDLLNESVGKFEEKNYDTFGRCFSLNINENVTSLGIITVDVVTRIGQYVYLHHPGQFLELDSRTKVWMRNNCKQNRIFLLLFRLLLCLAKRYTYQWCMRS